jgi:hypothetical protein
VRLKVLKSVRIVKNFLDPEKNEKKYSADYIDLILFSKINSPFFGKGFVLGSQKIFDWCLLRELGI